jgi:hypothetical protein
MILKKPDGFRSIARVDVNMIDIGHLVTPFYPKYRSSTTDHESGGSVSMERRGSSFFKSDIVFEKAMEMIASNLKNWDPVMGAS